jgi:hypothetical protein
MKKNKNYQQYNTGIGAISLFIGVALILITGVAFVALGPKSEEPDTISQSALVTTISSDVLVKLSENGSFENVLREAEAEEGAVVKTLENGRALIEVADALHATVDFNSEFSIEHLNKEKNQSRIVLKSGQIWSRVEKTLEQGEFYEIKTQNGVATVRGTEFNVSYKDGLTSIDVAEGEVTLSRIDEETQEIVPDSETFVRVGETALLADDMEEIRVIETPEEVRKSEWYVDNDRKDIETRIINEAAVGTLTDKDQKQDVIEKNVKDKKEIPRLSDDAGIIEEINSLEKEIVDIDRKQTKEEIVNKPDISIRKEETLPLVHEGPPPFHVSTVDIKNLVLRDGEEGIIHIVGQGLSQTDFILIGRFKIPFQVFDDTRLEAKVPFELPDGAHEIYLVSKDKRPAPAPVPIFITHESKPVNLNELQG